MQKTITLPRTEETREEDVTGSVSTVRVDSEGRKRGLKEGKRQKSFNAGEREERVLGNGG